MAIRDHVTRVPKLKAKITLVDPTTRRIEALSKDGTIRQIATWDIPSTFRWPVEGETWTIIEQNGQWFLGSRWHEDPDGSFQVESMSPGDARIDGDTIYDANGNALATTDYVGGAIAPTTNLVWAHEDRIGALEADRSQASSAIQVKYGAGVPASQGGVAPSTTETSRAMASGGWVYCFAAINPDMQLQLTADENCWWHVHFQTIAVPSDAAWVRADWRITLTQADAMGRTSGPVTILSNHSVVGWQTVHTEFLVKAAAGHSYGAAMQYLVSSGSGWTYWQGGTYFNGHAEIVGYW